jgi:hypothetical protein
MILKKIGNKYSKYNKITSKLKSIEDSRLKDNGISKIIIISKNNISKVNNSQVKSITMHSKVIEEIILIQHNNKDSQEHNKETKKISGILTLTRMTKIEYKACQITLILLS